MADFQATKANLSWELPFEGAWTTSVTFLGPSRVAAGNNLGQIFIWELPSTPVKGQTPPPVRRLDGHTNGIAHLRALADGKTLISSSLDHTIRIWDTSVPASGSAEVVMDAEEREREAKRGKKDALNQPGIKVEVQTDCHVLTGHKDWIRALGVSGDQRRLISGDDSAQVIVWDLSSRQEVNRWSGLPWNWMVGVALSADGLTALVSEFRYKRDDFDIPAAAVRLWDVSQGKEKLDILKVQFPKYDPSATSYGSAQIWRKFVADGLIAVAFSPNGKLLALGQGGETGTGVVHLVDASTGKLVRDVSGHQYGVTDILFTPDGKYLLTTGRDTTIRVIQVDNGKEIAKLGQPRGGQFKDWFNALSLSPDLKRVAAADIAGKVQVWTLG